MMAFSPELLAQLSAAIAGSLANAVLAGALLSAIASLGLRLVPGIRPSYRFVVWSVALVAVIGFHFVVPHVSAVAGDLPGRSLHLDRHWAYGIAAVWLFLAVFRLVRLVQGVFTLRGIVRRAHPVETGIPADLLLQRGRGIQLYTSEEIDRPCVIGFVQPRILLPAEIVASLPSSDLEHVVRHEMEHIRRGDAWSNLLQKLLLALFPLNPALAWIERRLCAERELACDDCVLRSISSRKQYALCLANLAEYSLLRRPIALALGALGRRSELAHRVDLILHRPRYSSSRGALAAMAATVAVATAAGTVALTQLPSLVSFSTASDAVVATAPAPATGMQLTAQPVSAVRPAAPLLVKAVMPEAAPAKKVSAKTIGSVGHASKLRTSGAAARQHLFVQTEYDERQLPPRMMFAVDERTGSSYAAVPVGNGWLVIQL